MFLLPGCPALFLGMEQVGHLKIVRLSSALEALFQPFELLRDVLLVGLPKLVDLSLQCALFRVDGSSLLQGGHHFLSCLSQALFSPRQLPADRLCGLLLGFDLGLQLRHVLKCGRALAQCVLESFPGLVPVPSQGFQLRC